MADEENKENSLPEPTIADLNEQIEAMTVQRDEYFAGWQRSKADFINYKKEEMKHLEEVMRYGSEDLIKDLISVMDNFDLALRTLEKTGPVEKGIYLIRTQIDDILKKRGLVKIDIKEGDEFDPSSAEALAEIASDKAHGAVVEVIEQGYRLHEKVLRPARVIVSKGI
jgi:molecular chaperone GrpE